MHRRSVAASISRSRSARLVAVGVLTLGLTAAAARAGANEHAHHGAPDADADCTATQQRALQRAGDNFAEGCLPGEEIAQLDDSEATLAPGETASSPNLSLIANIPKQGAFAPENSFNSDMAFNSGYAYAGNYNGFMVYDVRNPTEPKVVAQVVCPGSQNDISVKGDILILSVDSSRNDDSCSSVPQSAAIKESWEGIRVFDISNPAEPKYVAAVETDCGSHTHTLAPHKNGSKLYVYTSSYSPNATFPDCQPPHDKISVVKVPLDAPEKAQVVSTPVLFPDGGNPAGTTSAETKGCHDITAYPSKDIAAGACMGDGILLDITDREHPVVTEQVRDTTNFAFWHSATFNNAGTKVIFTDELGGGGAPTCNPTTGATKGADGIYDINGGKLELKSYYKMPRTQSNTENCVAHNGSLIPVEGKDIMVQAWYQGGISVFDFTDSANPKEIAWFDRGPLSDERLVLGGSWSAYYYNGYIYSNDIQMGLDVFDLNDPQTDDAKAVKMDSFNPQSQPSYNG